MRWLIALRLLLLPFQAPLTANAQSESVSTTTPACEFQLNTLKPGQFCVLQTLEFKPGDSNETIEQRKRDEEIQKQRELDYARAQLARKRSATQTPTTPSASSSTVSTSSGTNKLYPYSGQCIPFARARSGVAVSGTARSVRVTSKTPAVGAVVITYESYAGHAAVVTAVGDGYIHVIEGNYYRGWVSERDIAIGSGVIKGYVLPGT